MSMTVFEPKTKWCGFHFKTAGPSNYLSLLKTWGVCEEKVRTLPSEFALKIMEIVINTRVFNLSVTELLSFFYKFTDRKAHRAYIR